LLVLRRDSEQKAVYGSIDKGPFILRWSRSMYNPASRCGWLDRCKELRSNLLAILSRILVIEDGSLGVFGPDLVLLNDKKTSQTISLCMIDKT
jgi:hypothetical protein